jgi:hypothetical protein
VLVSLAAAIHHLSQPTFELRARSHAPIHDIHVPCLSAAGTDTIGRRIHALLPSWPQISRARHDAVFELLQQRDGVASEVVLWDGGTCTVFNTAWGYDLGVDHTHVTTNVSPSIDDTQVDFFHTDAVAMVIDPATGSTLLSMPAP